MKRAALHTVGCKVNAYETEAMREMLKDAGYKIVPFEEEADVYIVNTCTVTNMADRKSRQMLHRARKTNPKAVIVAAGCYAQVLHDENKGGDPAADIAIGNNRKKDLICILDEYEKKSDAAKEADGHFTDLGRSREYESLGIRCAGERTRAFIKVQDGCDRFCSYCIIPYARGRSRSREKDDVVDEAKRLADAGYKEIVLAGIHLSSYGVGLDKKESLLSLTEAVHEVGGIKRIRFSSLEPGIITREFVKAISAMPKVCPHFHLSLQSGCSDTLRRMNRRYTAEEYYEKCLILREYFENPALTTDVIVGFPGETDEEFEASRAFIEKVGFYMTHIFKYSMRDGTKAAAMPCQVPEEVKALRSGALISMGKASMERYERSFRGKEVEVLAEKDSLKEGRRIWTGHTREYMKISFASEKELKNKAVKVRIPTNPDFLIEI